MYAFKTLLAVATPLMVVANPLMVRNDPPATCNSGSAQCCKTVQDASNATPTSGLGQLLGLLGITAIVEGLIGTQCTPITGVGIGSSNCQNTVVCCTDNQFHGLINLGCSPITINL